MKLLVVGLGGVGQRHVRNIRTLLGDRVELLAWRRRRLSRVLTDQLSVEREGDVEERYGIRAHPTLESALSEQPTAVLICTPSADHVPVAMAAAQAGCHVFVEKPVSDSYDGVDELISLTDAKRLVTMVGYQLRFHPCLRRMHELLTAGAIGNVIAARAQVGEHLPSWHPYEDYRQLYAARRELGGGVILSQIHELDYLYWFFGTPQRVFALGGHLSDLEVDVEDTASILLECSVDGRRFPVHVHEDYVQRPPARTYEIVGDHGKLLLDFHAVTLHVYSDGSLVETFAPHGFERNRLFLDEMRHFLACLDGEETPVVNLREGAQSLRMALAARESMASGKVVQLTQ